MFRSSRTAFSILLLLLALLVPWSASAEAAEAEQSAWHTRLHSGDWAAQLWSALERLWAAGATIDPDGTSSAESGCSVDPDGRCAGGTQTASPDNGCSADPNGGCRD
jgi:hypothetical protein